MPLNVHIINHTHWDREWFLTAAYTNRWIPRLIDKLAQLVEQNPDYRFLLDGQTLVIEDLLANAPEYRPLIERLVRGGNLIIGPYYCQPDWQLAAGETLIRNLLYGQEDMQRFAAQPTPGWLVDTFGHISQAPQLHRMFGIQAVYVWRGVPRLAPYFHWQGPDGSTLHTVNLFGGYRNLYGITHTPDIALQRLQLEAEKLRPYYPTPDVPLFDGYDLEDNPEDPLRFYRQHTQIPPQLHLQDSTPRQFARLVARLPGLPTLHGELNSGKYGATFPGTLSARVYLKIMARDCEHLLYRLCEPLAALAALHGRPYPAQRYETLARGLLQNAVHDCICGVSIDQVHEKMEYTYRQTFDALQTDLADSLAHLLGGFAPGTYAVSTNPFPHRGWQPVNDRLIRVDTAGVGVWPVGESIPIQRQDQPLTTFTWQNDHYTAVVEADGVVRIGEGRLGWLRVSTENGDAYSEEPGELLAVCRPREMVLEQRSARHRVLRLTCAGEWEGRSLSATVRLTFDPSPLIRWQIDLDTRGTDFRVEAVFEPGHRGQVYAAMPFDVVQRPTADRDLLPRALEEGLARILLGQRETGAVHTFPFHDFLALSDGQTTTAVLAKGLRAYHAAEDGTLAVTLRRAVEWLTQSGLPHRVGDAGPRFYVPDARCERRVRHELAVAVGDFAPEGLALQGLNAGFQNPPLILAAQGRGPRRTWQFLREHLPLCSLHIRDGKILARGYNPASHPLRLERAYPLADVWGREQSRVQRVPPKKIVTLEAGRLPATPPEPEPAPVEILSGPLWRVGDNHGRPDPAIIAQLHREISRLQNRLAHLQAELEAETAPGHRRLLQHEYYVLKRQMYEYLLSARLNEMKRSLSGQPTPAYLFQPDEQIAKIGLELNHLRIKRRIFDYAVQVEG